jgi:outer membrane protein assembly factor BamB/predicted phosphodiesterase
MRNAFIVILVCASSLCAQQKNFRFAWLTDTHVGSETGEEDLRRSVRDINALNGISFVILSGDVTEMGTTKELRLAKSILDSLRVPYYAIPGNHDTKWSESGCSMFARLWKDDKFAFTFNGVTFIACSSGPNMRQGDGHVPEEDVRWLDSVIVHGHESGQPVVFILHYPLDESLDNWYDIVAEIKKANTIAALCGHGHANRRLTFEGVPGVMARSNLRDRKQAGGYTLVEVRADSLVFFERTPGMGLGADGGASAEGKQWHAVANAAHRYSADTTRYARPDFSVNASYSSVHERWRVNTGSTVGSSPAVAGECVIVGNNEGFVEGYSLRTGKKLWSFRTGASVYSTAAAVRVHGAFRAVVGSSDGAIYCLDARNGKVIWTHHAQGPVVASPMIKDGVVYCGASDGVFRALSLATGETVWEFAGVGGFVESTPIAYDRKIIFGAWDTYLYALDERTGTLVWKWSNGKATRNLSPAACTPVAANGKIFIVAPDRYTTALDAATGRQVWRSAAHQVREMIGISEDARTVYARTMNDTLLAFAPEPDSLQLLWSADCKYGYDFAPSMPVEKDGSIFFGTKNGLVYCVSARTHALEWIHKVGNTVITTVRPLSSTDVLVASMNGSVVCINNKH